MKLNVDEWKSFKIIKLFTRIESCKCGDAGSLEDGDDINYIGAKWRDNGVMARVSMVSNLVSKGNGVVFICSGDGSAGYAIYQDKDFIGSTTLKVGYIDGIMTPKIGLFIATVLCKERPKYGYGRKWLAERFTNTIIDLPILRDSNGNAVIDTEHKYSDEGYIPDWQYMEDFMGGAAVRAYNNFSKVFSSAFGNGEVGRI